MSLKFDRLVSLLRELFQLDQPDLDFGLYRIMHAKAAEVTQFLEKDLLPQVRKAFEQYQPADKSAVQKRLAESIAAAESLGVDPNTNPKVAAIKVELAAAVDLSALEDEVFDHLHSFFRRYYSEGDFLSKRVYKPGVYAVPYEGEEVMLHWANKDQYYIKTSEYLRDYAFRLKPDSDTNPMRVHFRLAEVAEGEHGNIKAAEGKDRVFILTPAGESGRDFIEIEKVNGQDELVIKFAYRPAKMEDWTEDATRSATEAAAKKPPTQKVLSDLAIKAILAVRDTALATWITELAKPHVKVGGEQADYSRLQGHLSRYTARHTFDYFIHKDLGGFLRRELDFYVKNEVMHLDDIESESAPKVEQYLSKIKVIRAIAGKIIAFVAQLEAFQCKLWRKHKFAYRVSYLVTLDRVPDNLLAAVVNNAAQLAEWNTQLSINEIEGDLATPGFSSPLSINFLRHHQYLTVNTAHFDQVFTDALISTITDVDTHTMGLIVASDNAHALRLLSRAFSNKIRFIYLDPPYNTGGDSFLFKDSYAHSTWLAMIAERLAPAPALLDSFGLLFCSIDGNERRHLDAALRLAFGGDNLVEELIWVQNSNKNQSPTYSTVHEYILTFAKDLDAVKQDVRMLREPKPGYAEVNELIAKLNAHYPTTAKIEEALGSLYKQHKLAAERGILDGTAAEDEWKGLYNYSNAEYRDAHGTYVREEDARRLGALIWIWRESDPSMPQVKKDSQKPEYRDENSPTFRFYRPLHPVTGKPCPPPKTGWRWPQERHGNQTTCFSELASDNRIVWGVDEIKIPQTKRFLHEVDTNVAKSVIADFTDGEKELANLFGRSRVFSNPKPSTLIARLCSQSAARGQYCMDYFAGSGTTAHAVIALNREDGGNRKFVLVEAGEHVDSIILPRIQKLVYSARWSDGRPVARQSGLSAIVKVLRLEQYEDSVNNLVVSRDKDRDQLLARPETRALTEQYMLRYMLDTETRGSPSLLNIRQFADPTAYTMRIKRPGTDESVVTAVDLIETFNWLIGLTVTHFAAPQTFTADFERDDEGRLRLKGSGARGGRLKPAPDGKWWFRTVTGKAPDGKRVLVIWRKRPGGDTPEGIEQDNLVLDEWFRKQGYSTSDAEFDLIYVNGDNNLGNLRQEEADEKGLTETGWKLRVIEEDFHRLMFDTEGT